MCAERVGSRRAGQDSYQVVVVGIYERIEEIAGCSKPLNHTHL